jgi:hypothetical protein
LRAEGEGLFEVVHEDAHAGGGAAAVGANGGDGHGSLVRREETEYGAFAELGGEEPGGSLGDAEMLEHAHAELFEVGGAEDS